MSSNSDVMASVPKASRRGLGHVRHFDVCHIWLQEKVRRGDITVIEIGIVIIAQILEVICEQGRHAHAYARCQPASC
eukprot:8227602-Pyramimonas_sp.AAC.1